MATKQELINKIKSEAKECNWLEEAKERQLNLSIDNLLDGHAVVKMSNSGKDWGMTKSGAFAKKKGVSRSWIKKNLDGQDIKELISGGVVGLTQKRGRGFSYVEYYRVKL